MVACGRGVAALPRWLVKEQQGRFELYPVRLGKKGVDKQIFLGLRLKDAETDYMKAFVELARSSKSFAQ
jgi:LysR family transcriptional regulator for metE and metH